MPCPSQVVRQSPLSLLWLQTQSAGARVTERHHTSSFHAEAAVNLLFRRQLHLDVVTDVHCFLSPDLSLLAMTKPPGRKLRCRIHFHCSMAKFVVHAAARPCARVSRSAMFSIQDGSTGVRIAGLVSRSAHASCLSCQEAGHSRISSTLVYSTPPP